MVSLQSQTVTELPCNQQMKRTLLVTRSRSLQIFFPENLNRNQNRICSKKLITHARIAPAPPRPRPGTRVCGWASSPWSILIFKLDENALVYKPQKAQATPHVGLKLKAKE